MAKEKQSHYAKIEKDLTFYYEIVGIISIIIPILGFARLGNVGFYIMLIFKIVFGDWYFLFLLTMMIYGLRCLIYHKPMDLKRMRVIGVCLILLGVLILSHFPMHKYIVSFDVENTKGYYGKTLGLYLDYFKNYYDGMVVGGGIIGASFFYLFYSLLSSVGTAFIIIVLLFIGIVFVTEKTVNDFFSDIYKKIKWIYNKIKKRFKNFKYDIKIEPKSSHKKRIKLSDLKEPTLIKFLSYEQKNAEEFRIKLKSILNKMNVFYGDVLVTVGYNVTTYLIDTQAYIDLKELNKILKEEIQRVFIIKKEVKTKKIFIEVLNEYASDVEIKTVLDEQKDYQNNYLIPFGYTSLKVLKEINFDLSPNLLIEDSKDYSMPFIKALITMFYIKNKPRYFKINVYLDDFEIKKLTKNFNILQLIETANEILNTLNVENCENIDEYNNKKEKVIYKKQLLIVDQKILEGNETKDKIAFLLQVSKKIGYFIVLIINSKQTIDPIYENYFEYHMYFKDSKDLDISKHLSEKECFITFKGEIERVTPVSISTEQVKLLMDNY